MTAAQHGPTPLDRALDALRHPYRRRALRLVADRHPAEGVLSVDRLVDAAARPDGDRPDAVRTALHHVHLPRLDDAGYVAWDRTTGTVRPGPNFAEVEPVLRVADEYRREILDRE